MTGTKIKVGEYYRYGENRSGTYFQKVKVTKFISVSKWDRKTMSYTTVPGKVEVEFEGGGTRDARFQDIIEPWEEFKERDPQKAAQYEYRNLKNKWEENRKRVLVELAANKLDEIDNTPYVGLSYGRTPSFYIQLSMTVPQYLAWVGKTMEEWETLAGPAPVNPIQVS
jgi:hypothetical protein